MYGYVFFLFWHTAILRAETIQNYSEPASIIYRLCAWILDTTIGAFGLLLVTLGMLFAGMGLFHLPLSSLSVQLSYMESMNMSDAVLFLSSTVVAPAAALFALVLLILYVYSAFFESACNGKTPGKYLLRIRVLDGTDLPPSFNDAFKRNLYKSSYLGTLLLGLMLCGVLAKTPAVSLVPVVSIGILVISFLLFTATYIPIF